MECERCHVQISEQEKFEYQGKRVCEDCYLDLLSPAKTCDPWAVYTAKSCLKDQNCALSPLQTRLLDLLQETGGLEPDDLARRLGIKLTDLEREIAALRHMEKVRAKAKGGKKIICLW